MSTTTIYQITGMTCSHCVSAVSQELSVLPGVRHVEVDLGTGTAKVTSDAVLPLDQIRNAVDEAGYELAGIDG
ncbi:MAG TPA: heavy metal-associated domain-containing protein [Candidatus Limnocylindrales bacterium]